VSIPSNDILCVCEWVAAVQSSTTTQQCGSSLMRTAEQSGVEQDRIRNCTGRVCVCASRGQIKTAWAFGRNGRARLRGRLVQTLQTHTELTLFKLNVATERSLIQLIQPVNLLYVFCPSQCYKDFADFLPKLLYYKSAFAILRHYFIYIFN